MSPHGRPKGEASRMPRNRGAIFGVALPGFGRLTKKSVIVRSIRLGKQLRMQPSWSLRPLEQLSSEGCSNEVSP